MDAVARVASRFMEPQVDRSDDQGKLDLSRRSRTSLFPWRGQFSPELVELLVEDLPDGLIVDPFVGSGTTLYEAARVGSDAVGAEINPAALCFAVLSDLISQPLEYRIEVGREASAVVASELQGALGGLFGELDAVAERDDAETVKVVLAGVAEHDVADLVRAALLLAMGQSSTVDLSSLARKLLAVRRLIEGLPQASGRRRAVGADARDLPLDDGSASASVTSPPYINVFNYHQHYRSAVEMMGAGPLAVARAELGSNRKHRQNRFLTVVQYAMDMADALIELRRVLAPGGIAKMVVGRESNVRGVPFRNGHLIATLAEGCGTFTMERWQERRFTTRFGDSIYEDVLSLRRTSDLRPVDGFTARAAGVWALEQALATGLAPDVRSDVAAAVDKAEAVLPSPCFEPASVPWMQGRDLAVSNRSA
jgi:SAM-dependent methyltransferase